MIPQVNLFPFVFLRKLKTQKDISKLTDLFNITKFNLLTLSNLELTLDDVPLFHTLWHQSHPKIVTPTTYDGRQQEAAEQTFCW